VLECGRPDPWNYDELPLTDKQVKGARAAAEHLLACDLTPLMDVDTLRALWRAGHRELAAELARSAVEL
jgi:hypothetical protein